MRARLRVATWNVHACVGMDGRSDVDRVAAVITEPVQGAGGVFPPPEGYLTQLRRLCDDHGAFLIMDEVICGFGRLGTLFASEYYDVVPDLITTAKGITSSYAPLGAVMIRAEPIPRALRARRHEQVRASASPGRPHRQSL